MKIFYFDRTGGACDYYRATLPITTLARIDKSFEVMGMTKADLLNAIENDNQNKAMCLLDADVIVLPRLSDTKFFDQMKELNPRAKIVLEYDDNLFSVSPFSPHYEDHGTEEVIMEFADGKKLEVWIDGKNINIAKNKTALDGIKRVMGMADMVTVTTDILAEVYKPYSKIVKALPNCIDGKLWNRLPLMQRNDIRMGWFGGHSHYEDWTLLTPVLSDVMRKYPNIKLVIMGSKFAGTMKDIPEDRIEFHQWITTDAYPYKSAILDLDFAIIPLRDNKFNRCKSNIKWVEMGALKVPSVTSLVSPYKEHATEENGVWIEGNSAESWKVGISLITENAILRRSLGENAYNTVMSKFEINGQAHLWGDAYKGLSNVN